MESQLRQVGDGLLTIQPDGIMGWAGRAGFHMQVSNNAGHVLTYRIMYSVVLALYEYMSNSHWAEVAFDIYDGGVKVGTGFLSR